MQELHLEVKAARESIDKLKIKHKNALASVRNNHAKAMKSKVEQLKEAEELSEGLQVMFGELLDEVDAATSASRKLETKFVNAKRRAQAAHTAYVQHKLLNDVLTDEIRDSQVSSDKVGEYEEVIDYLSREIEDQQREFDDILTFIDHCSRVDSDSEQEKPQPKKIAKHYVPNRSGRGTVYYFSYHLSLVIAPSRHLFSLISQR